MEQSSQIEAGELNYDKVTSKHGPLVYPAVHTYIYLFMYKYITQNGTYHRPAQLIGSVIYLI
jgi:hypothetical protein